MCRPCTESILSCVLQGEGFVCVPGEETRFEGSILGVSLVLRFHSSLKDKFENPRLGGIVFLSVTIMTDKIGSVTFMLLVQCFGV